MGARRLMTDEFKVLFCSRCVEPGLPLVNSIPDRAEYIYIYIYVVSNPLKCH